MRVRNKGLERDLRLPVPVHGLLALLDRLVAVLGLHHAQRPVGGQPGAAWVLIFEFFLFELVGCEERERERLREVEREKEKVNRTKQKASRNLKILTDDLRQLVHDVVGRRAHEDIEIENPTDRAVGQPVFS